MSRTQNLAPGFPGQKSSNKDIAQSARSEMSKAEQRVQDEDLQVIESFNRRRRETDMQTPSSPSPILFKGRKYLLSPNDSVEPAADNSPEMARVQAAT